MGSESCSGTQHIEFESWLEPTTLWSCNAPVHHGAPQGLVLSNPCVTVSGNLSILFPTKTFNIFYARHSSIC